MGTLNVNTLAAPGGTTTISNATVVDGNFESNGIDDNVGSDSKKIVLSTTDGEHVLIKGDLKVEENLEVLGSVVNQSSNAIWARWSGTIDFDNSSDGLIVAESDVTTITHSGLDNDFSDDLVDTSNRLRIDFKPAVDADDYTVIVSIGVGSVATGGIYLKSVTKSAGNFRVLFGNSASSAHTSVPVDIIMAV